MDIFGVLKIIGGLAMFLYGMKTMGDGLSGLSGSRLKRVLERMTARPWMALLLGAGVTAVIQSSSATTVMVVGFVDACIMNLSQAAGIIMGANIGTTITSWLLSLTEIDSTNWIVQMFKPTSFAPILALVGVIMNMLPKKTERQQFAGSILIGFAILMFGMEMMCAAVAPLRSNEAFTGMLTMFEHPLAGMAVGLILTAVIQSSSASVGILQALCITGTVSLGAAIPIIMGQNIGTCVTALLSSGGASKNARRASMIHLYFNLIGTIIFMAAFYAVHVFVDFGFVSRSASAVDIALVHSLFNIGAAVLLFPFQKYIIKLAQISVPEKVLHEPVSAENT